MSRFSLLRLPPFLVARFSKTFPSLGNPILLHNHRRSSPPEISSSPHSPLSGSFKNPFPLSFRYLSSSPSSSSSPANVVLLGSEEGFDAAFKKATDEKSSSIFYFTAAWCGPCRLIYPVVEQMSKEFPHVTTYKLDIDQEGITATLRKLQIFSVATMRGLVRDRVDALKETRGSGRPEGRVGKWGGIGSVMTRPNSDGYRLGSRATRPVDMLRERDGKGFLVLKYVRLW